MQGASFSIVFGILLMGGAGALAQASLGNEAADKAMASLKARAGTDITCAVKGSFVVCTGLRTGDCLAEGWLISHDGSECRKKLE